MRHSQISLDQSSSPIRLFIYIPLFTIYKAIVTPANYNRIDMLMVLTANDDKDSMHDASPTPNTESPPILSSFPIANDNSSNSIIGFYIIIYLYYCN